MHMTPMDSSQIASVGFDAGKKELHVRFQRGSTYVYSGVSSDVHSSLLRAESAGKFLNSNIKGKFDFRKV